MDIRIGITHAPRELSVEIDDDQRDEVKAQCDAVVDGSATKLTLTDKRGRDILIPASNIAYIELGSADGDRRIGFGG